MAHPSKLRKVGNAVGLLVPAAVLRRLGWLPGMALELRTTDEALVIWRDAGAEMAEASGEEEEGDG